MRHTARQTRQTIENLRGEIEFREKLSRQHVSGEIVLPDYYDRDQHDAILRQRVADTLHKMKELKDRGIALSPFLELGAERGQRSLALTNDFGAAGFAIDISFHQLRTMEHFAQLFSRPKLPIRICCDANHLPFRNGSFPFVFCYEFLHHFPALKPVIEEIDRVLSNGTFFFAEEPLKRMLKVALYSQKHKAYSERARGKNKYLAFVESFISETPCDETAHGIIEKQDISLAEWMEALSIFQDTELELVSFNNLSSKLGRRLSLRNLTNVLLGGSISGLCRKTARGKNSPTGDVYSCLGCPDCTTPTPDGNFDRPPLMPLFDGFKCSQCGFKYPCREGIIFLLPRAELQQLYPDL